MLRANQLKVNVQKNREQAIRDQLCKQYRIRPDKLNKVFVRKLSIDARKKTDIKWVCTVDFIASGEEQLLKKNKSLAKSAVKKYPMPVPGEKALKQRPIIVGFGPAGMFAGLILSELGYNPIILDRGQAVEERSVSVEKFWKESVLNTSSNVQFGEGGAGTFSDGKLTTRIKDIRVQKILDALVEGGGPEEIIYTNKPHIGTDVLKGVVINIRKKIIKNGGDVRFNQQVTDLVIKDNQITGVELASGETLSSPNVILAVGHSARDTFELIRDRGVAISPKPFAIGARIEHPQSLIDQSQYGDKNYRELLGAADYALTHQATNGRAVYTFCMCPGGSVIGSASETGQVVTNGMSEHARNNVNANSALLVNVTPADFGGDDPLAGMYFQRAIEEKAFELAGKNYYAPMTTVLDLLGESSCTDKKLNETIVNPSFEPGTEKVDFKDLLPEYMIEAMQEGIQAFGKKIKGFDMDQSVITGVETRTSSPIRIVREQDTLQSTTIKGLYPCGEGAGYAGGIISSAVDGIKCAEKIIEQFQAIEK